MLQRTCLALTLFFAACSSTTSSQTQRDLSLQSAGDLSMASVNDLAEPVATVDFAGLDFASANPPDLARPTGGCHPVINELLTGTTQEGTEEWIEIFNPCPTDVNLSDWSLRYRSDKNVGYMGGDTMLVTNLTKTIGAGAHFLWAGIKYGGTKDGDLSSGLGVDGGGVALFDATMNIVDAVAYGSAVPNHNFLEGTVAPKPPIQGSPGRTIARTPNGTDSENNGADFKIATPTARAAN